MVRAALVIRLLVINRTTAATNNSRNNLNSSRWAKRILLILLVVIPTSKRVPVATARLIHSSRNKCSRLVTLAIKEATAVIPHRTLLILRAILGLNQMLLEVGQEPCSSNSNKHSSRSNNKHSSSKQRNNSNYSISSSGNSGSNNKQLLLQPVEVISGPTTNKPLLSKSGNNNFIS